MKVLRLNVAVLGDSAVGKSVLCDIWRRAATEPVSDPSAPYTPTIGPRVVSRRVAISDEPGAAVELFLIDCPGCPALNSVVPEVVAECAAAIYVCDVARPETAQNLRMWSALFAEATLKDEAPLLVVAAKDDSDAGDASPAYAIAQDFAAVHGAWLVSTTARYPKTAQILSEWASRLWADHRDLAYDELDLM